MPAPYQNQNQNTGSSSAGGGSGQQPYVIGQPIRSYQQFTQTAPPPWAGGPPSGQGYQTSQQTQGYPTNGASGPGPSGYTSQRQ